MPQPQHHGKLTSEGGAAAQPRKSCHNCRRRRLRCDRSTPTCNKCAAMGQECLGYGKLFIWTHSVASRGKMAGKTSMAPTCPRSPTSPTDDFNSPKQLPGNPPASRSTSPTTQTYEVGSDECQSLVHVKPDLEDIPSPRLLLDPLFQDIGSPSRYYLNHCM
jgi:hypothetical protein